MNAEFDRAQFLVNVADKNWRLHNLYSVVTTDARQVLFRPNHAQRSYLKSATGFDLILKSRQHGFTTLVCIDHLDSCLFQPNFTAGIIAHKRDEAERIFETKVRFPYEQLPSTLKAMVTADNDRAGMLRFSNGSSIFVTSSARSGTLQALHISEFGKLCAQFPHRAEEVVTGSFPAVGNNKLTIESTAEGDGGYFYDYCQRAMAGNSEFKFHFYAWYHNPKNVWPVEYTAPTKRHDEYFLALKMDEGLSFSPEQISWYVREEGRLGATMKREHPSTPEEAFAQAIEGTYFAEQLAHATNTGAIGRFPFDPKYPVNTFWDLGRNDLNTIWLHQRVKARNRLVGYYENSGEDIAHYANWLREWAYRHNAKFDRHYWPHDGGRNDLFIYGDHGRVGVGQDVGLSPIEIVDRPATKQIAVEVARAVFASCDFDESGCEIGLRRLRHYRKEMNALTQIYRDRPRHDINSHAADAFMTFACGYKPPFGGPSAPIIRPTGTI